MSTHSHGIGFLVLTNNSITMPEREQLADLLCSAFDSKSVRFRKEWSACFEM